MLQVRNSVLLLLLLVSSALAQGLRVEPLGPLDFEIGTVTGLRITAPNAKDGELIKLPEIDGLRIEASGPKLFSMTRNINGRESRSSSLSWDLSIRPQRVGTFEIPELSLKIDGKVLRTRRRFTVHVRENLFARGRAFVELKLEPERPYLHQSVRVRLRFGLKSERNLVEGIVDPGWNVSVPIRLSAPWLSKFPAGLVSESAGVQANKQCVLGNQRVAVQRLASVKRGDDEFIAFELSRRFYINKVGSFELSPVQMQFYWADPRQRPDFFGRRQQTRIGNVSSDGGAVLEVRPLPEAGRPAAFANAVGAFSLEAKLNKRSFDVGENIELRLDLLGSGNFNFVELPGLDKLSGFNVFGREIKRQADRVIARYELVALSDSVKELPAIELPYFDPEKEGYFVARSEAIPVEVTPLAGGGGGLAPLPSEREDLVPGVDDVFDRIAIVGAPPKPFRPSDSLLWLALLAPWGLFALGFGFVYWRRVRASDPARLRRAGAAQRFSRRLTEEGPLRALTAYLADRLNVEEGALLHRDLAAWLGDHEVEEGLAKRAAELMEELAASRYGGVRDEQLDAERAQDLVNQFERGEA
ncbi:MAG: hypothetical protein CSA62_05480 [Planctomycetota bacterium]|nr:MAG: hypothetical protein CSA62_05480 [Planctomycetota bacterium]